MKKVTQFCMFIGHKKWNFIKQIRKVFKPKLNTRKLKDKGVVQNLKLASAIFYQIFIYHQMIPPQKI